jgi:hypothetical protein
MGSLRYSYNGSNQAISATTPDGLVIEFSNRCISGYRGVVTSGVWANGDDRPFLANVEIPNDPAIRSQMPIASRRSINWNAHYGSYTDPREAAYIRALSNADPIFVDNWFEEHNSRGDVDRYFDFPAYVYELPLTVTVDAANKILAARAIRRNANKKAKTKTPKIKARKAGQGSKITARDSANSQVRTYASIISDKNRLTANLKGLVMKIVTDRDFETYEIGKIFVDGVIANATR